MERGSVKAAPLQSLCAQWEPLWTGPHPASVEGGVRASAPLRLRHPFHRDFKERAFTVTGGKYF